MNCNIYNNAGVDFGDLESHIQDMYGFFANKYSFDKHPDIHLDSDEQNKAELLGKTAYYDPQSHEVHIYTDNRHPKDMLRSIAHELIHHKQNLEDRLQVGGYNGPGYYLKNDKLKEIEHEAMLEGNACMREWEDTKKYTNPKESNNMSLNEWKNNELNQLLLKKFGILTEGKKKGKYDDGDGKDEKCDYVDCGDNEKSDKKKSSKPKKGKIPDQFKKNKKEDKDMDESSCMEEGNCKDHEKLEEKDCPKCKGPCKCEEMKESNCDKKKLEETEGRDMESQYRRMEMLRMKPNLTPEEQQELLELMQSFQMMRETNNKLQESIQRIAKAKKVFLNGKRIK